jgi:hypothetical protein
MNGTVIKASDIRFSHDATSGQTVADEIAALSAL